MVTRKNIRSHALISVYDKSNLNKICLVFKKNNIGIISTGSTAKKIKDLGFKCQQVSELTKTKEMLNGRVKTLNHKIHASILFNRKKKDHIKRFQNLKFPKIDYVIVNFYPFNNTYINKNKLDKIETIDIGGPAMIRSASKNFDFVTTVSSTKYYKEFVDELNKNKGSTSLKFRIKMAKNNFKETSAYDRTIYRWFNKNSKKEKTNNKIKIKYGENANQKAFFISNSKQNIINSQISGKKIGYNNIPNCTYCKPEVASIGLSEENLNEKSIKFKKAHSFFNSNGKAVAVSGSDGFIKILVDESNHILGAHIIGSNATEMISELSVVKSNNLSIDSVLSSVHPHPTFSEAIFETLLQLK